MVEKPRVYTLEEMEREVAHVPGWRLRDGALERTWKFKDFVEAVDFVNRLAPIAEARDHHPDVHIHDNEVTLRLWTHSEDAITDRDVELAKELSGL